MSGENDPPEVVFDCVVFLQAAANEKGPSGRALDLLDTGEIKLLISEEILLEIRNALNHRRVRQRLRGITDERVEALIKRLDKLAIPVNEVPRAFDYPRDPKDEPYINLAIVAGAKYLVTRDNDLLDLMTAEDQLARTFRQLYPTLSILNPVAFLNQIRR